MIQPDRMIIYRASGPRPLNMSRESVALLRYRHRRGLRELEWRDRVERSAASGRAIPAWRGLDHSLTTRRCLDCVAVYGNDLGVNQHGAGPARPG